MAAEAPQRVISMVRLLLTGRTSSSRPAIADISLMMGTVVRELRSLYSTCIDALTDVDEIAAYHDAIACLIASRMIRSPDSGGYTPSIAKIRQGSMVLETNGSLSVKDAIDYFESEGVRNLYQIACIKTAIDETVQDSSMVLVIASKRNRWGEIDEPILDSEVEELGDTIPGDT